jgi:hypothetical protein
MRRPCEKGIIFLHIGEMEYTLLLDDKEIARKLQLAVNAYKNISSLPVSGFSGIPSLAKNNKITPENGCFIILVPILFFILLVVLLAKSSGRSPSHSESDLTPLNSGRTEDLESKSIPSRSPSPGGKSTHSKTTPSDPPSTPRVEGKDTTISLEELIKLYRSYDEQLAQIKRDASLTELMRDKK